MAKARVESVERLRARFGELESGLVANEPGWLATERREALERFAARGFPTTRDEAWRFTSVASLAAKDFALPNGTPASTAAEIKTGLGLALDAHEIVLVNGRFSRELSSLGTLPSGVFVGSLAEALPAHGERVEALVRQQQADEARETPFFDLNQAFSVDGAFVHLPRGAALEKPLHILHLSDGSSAIMTHPRTLISAETGSEARVVETFAGREGAVYWTNAVTVAAAEENAVLDHYKLQLESEKAFHVASLDFWLERNASVSSHSISLGAGLARNDIGAALAGEGADVTLNGLYVVKGDQHVDHHTVIDHRVPHGTSRELYKGVLDDTSSAVFNGSVIVRPKAQKTDSQQSNKNLLLSESALVNSNPQLEIHADDVKCAHGATIGQLDENMLFYLRSRGIGIEQARQILTEGFMADVSERIRLDSLRAYLKRLIFGESST